MRDLYLRLFGLVLAMCVLVDVHAFSVPRLLNNPRTTTLLATTSGEQKPNPVKRVVNKVKKVSKKVVNKVKKSENNVKKSQPTNDALSKKYAEIDCVQERAYQILLDLDMITENKGKAKKL